MPAARALVAGAHLGGLDRAVGGEVTARDQVDHVAAGLVGAGDPAGPVDDARVDEVADAGGLVRAEHPRADVALDQLGVVLEVLEDRGDGRFELGAQALLVDLTVAGEADGEDLLRAVGRGHRDEDVLEGVAGRPGTVVPGERALRWSTSVAMVGVSGVSSTCAAGASVQSSAGGTGTRTASTFAAYPQFGHRT